MRAVVVGGSNRRDGGLAVLRRDSPAAPGYVVVKSLQFPSRDAMCQQWHEVAYRRAVEGGDGRGEAAVHLLGTETVGELPDKLGVHAGQLVEFILEGVAQEHGCLS